MFPLVSSPPSISSYSSSLRPISLEDLSDDVQSLIISFLGLSSATALAETNRHFQYICRKVHGRAVRRRPQSLITQNSVTGPLSSLIATSHMVPMTLSHGSSVGHSSSDDDTMGSHDTGMTTPEEDEWVFKITPDLVRRLSLLPQLNSGPTLESLPNELQLEIFSHLDKIDSVCLGLASPKIYPIYRAIHGVRMPLNTRRIGPNSLESAWEVFGKQQCKQCGIYRCELHQHIKTWMPKGLDYCAFKQNFGLAATENANATCYRGKPSKPKRCGRHPLRTTSVHQDDGLAMTAIAR